MNNAEQRRLAIYAWAHLSQAKEFQSDSDNPLITFHLEAALKAVDRLITTEAAVPGGEP